MFGAIICKSQSPVFVNITSDQNLPSNYIYSIIQDKEGFIWLGTDVGLYKFNGSNYIFYHSPKQKSRAITGLTLSKDGRIYFHSFTNQVFYIQDGIIEEVDHPYTRISGISTDLQSNLWLSHQEGTSFWNQKNKNWSLIKKGQGRFAINNKNQNIYVSHDQGLTIYNGNQKKEISSTLFPKINFGQITFVFNQNIVWLFDHLSAKIIKIENDIPVEMLNTELGEILQNKKITNVKILKDGFIWISTYSGLIKFDPKTESIQIYYENIAFTNSIIDREGNYWFTTLSNGYFILPNSEILVYNHQNELLPNEKINFIQIYDSILYFCTSDGHVGELNISTKSKPQLYYSGLKGDINTLFYDSKTGKTYFNIMQKLLVLKNNEINKIHNFSYPIKYIEKAFGKFFIGSSYGLQIQENIELNSEDFVITEWINNIIVDSINNKVFVGSNNGVFELDFYDGILKNKYQFLKNKQIRGLSIDRFTNILYIITIEGQIYQYKEKQFKLLEKLNDEILVNHLLFHENYLIISCNQGLKILDLKTRKWFLINQNIGLASNDIKQTITNGNFLWAASSRGIHKIPINFTFNKPKPLLYLRKLSDGKKDLNKNKIEIDYNKPLHIYYEIASYISLGKNTISYRINNGEWIKIVSNNEEIVIPTLQKGAITIQLKATDLFGRDSEETITIEANVMPPFWQKWWFVIFVLLIFSSLIYHLIKRRFQNISNQQKIEFDKINLQNQLYLSQEVALKAQMKPHFIFNVLNTIKSYIYENDKERALKYLKLFSDLVRTVLEMSSNPKITLEEEIKTLKYYIELEEMLLEEDFDCELIVDEDLMPSEINIPSLIIQPFVENAFKHGLRHKHGQKKIIILIKYLNVETIEVIIEDNGIGREAAKKINAETAKIHHSFATDTSKKRIDLLNFNKKGLIGLEYKDLFNDFNESSGTQVVLRININE